MTDIMNDWYGPDAATFGDRVAAARESAGMTQGQLARRMGVKVLRFSVGFGKALFKRTHGRVGKAGIDIPWLFTAKPGSRLGRTFINKT